MNQRISLVAIAVALVAPSVGWADEPHRSCSLSSSTVGLIQSQLLPVTQLADANGGIFKPNRMWPAVVDRQGNRRWSRSC
jgi:hypothetical protein